MKKRNETPGYILEALEALRPPEYLKPSVWAEEHRVLSSRESPSMPGPWRNENMPHLVDIMDELVNPETEKVIFVKSTQIGGTEILNNWLGYIPMQAPCPALLAYPNDALGEFCSENRLKPMYRRNPKLRKLFKENASKRNELQFEGMDISIVGGGSAAELSSRPRKFVAIDEADKFPGATAKEADSISLALERLSGQTDPFAYITSTPTTRIGRVWREMERAHILKHRFVQCPHCEKWIEFKFAQIRGAPKESGLSYADRAAQAKYYCQECGCEIDDRQKRKMLRQGRWIVVRRNAEHARSVAYWINRLYSPTKTWEDILLEFFESKDDPEKLQNFANSWLAEPWEDTKLKTTAELVMERQTEIPSLELPAWAKVLTAGVDVQETSLYWTIRAWGDHFTSQNIAHGQAVSFGEIERVMNLEYKFADDGWLPVDLCLVDSGDQTDAVYNFCFANAEWALPCKGIDGGHAHYRVSRVNRATSRAHGMKLVLVDGSKYKDMIASRMRRPNGEGSWMVHADCDVDYAEQVTAEHKVLVKSGNKSQEKWIPKASHADNHYLDTEVYALAAADMLGVRALHLESERPAEHPVKTDGTQQSDKDELQAPEQDFDLNRGLGDWII